MSMKRKTTIVENGVINVKWFLLRQLALKLEKRAPGELSPKPDPYEFHVLRGCSFLFPTAIANGGQSIRANFIVTKSIRRQTSTAIDRQTRVSLIFCGLAPPRLAP